MRKITFYLLLTLSLSACNLNIPPIDEIYGLESIHDLQTARETLNGAYASFPVDAYFKQLAMLSEDFYPTIHAHKPLAVDYLQFYNWNRWQLKTETEELWKNYYKALQKANLTLSSLPYIKQTKQEELDLLEANAIGLKALIYSDLLMLFADRYEATKPGIVLRDNINDIQKKGRSSSEDCLEEIYNLIAKGKSLLKAQKQTSKEYFNYNAFFLLEARVALYAGDLERAIENCNTLINTIGEISKTGEKENYKKTWSNEDTAEKIFAFSAFHMQYQFVLQQYIDSDDTGDYFAINLNFIFSDEDIRNEIASFSFTPDNNKPNEKINLIGKYRLDKQDKTPKNINALRIAEAYYILAECYAEQNNIEESKKILNTLLSNRKKETVDSSISLMSLKEKIFTEKQKEFLGEGLNFFDLKRKNRNIRRFKLNGADIAATISANDYRLTFPIPLQEIKESDFLVTQNRGWSEN